MYWQYLILKGISFFLCILPYRMVLLVGKIIGFLHYTFGHSQRRRAMQQLQERLGINPVEATTTAKKMYRQIGQTFAEMLYVPALTPLFLERHVTIEGAHYLHSALAYGRGVVVVTAHFGNWEWMGARLALAGFPMAAIAKEQPNSGLDRLINEYRKMEGIEPFSRSNALAAAMKALRRGKVLGFLADQDGRKDGIFVDFFNVESSAPRGPALFAIRTGAPIVPVYIIRHGRGHRILVHQPILPNLTADEEFEMHALTERTSLILEKRIRQYPDHWWWFQRRWLTTRKIGESVQDDG